ncbi:MAG: TIGR04283 family arsenosugar biosynthesis glycosyltransferase [Spirochaetota bacterium]
MIPRLSIVIPVYREPLALPRCLARLAACPQIGSCEVIVSEADEGASIVPAGILPVRTVRSQAGRGRQLDAGARAARADVLVFLHVDTSPPRGFVRLVLEATGRAEAARGRRRRPADAGAFDLHIDASHPFIRAVSMVGLLRSRVTAVPYGDQIQFATREAYEAAGGYPHVPIMEDVALMDRLARAGRRIVLLRPPARTSARRWETEGPVRTTLRNRRIMLAYRSGVSPQTLRVRYRPQSDIEPHAHALIAFHRALRPGHVKTRLAASVGDETALQLYRAMLDDLARETRVGVARMRSVRTLWFIDDPAAGYGAAGGSYPQIGDDLWQRMHDAMRRTFATGARRVVLVGSDIPALDRAVLRRAFEALRTHEVVIGPSDDGGFYLLGCNAGAFDEALFAQASRDADRSGSAILRWAQHAGHRVATLPRARDVDTVTDLEAVLADPSVRARALRRAVRRAGLTLPILEEREDS